MTASAPSRWHTLADRVLAGGELERAEALAILAAPDEELLDLLAAAYRVRHKAFGNTVQLFFLMNAKSGLCPEDCGYCSQSKVSEAEIPRYNLLSAPKLMEAARLAAEQQSKTFCIVISARGPTQREIDFVCEITPRIKAEYGLNICACLGLLTPEQAGRLAAAGVDKVNHNLNTSERYYGEICSTHSYADRMATLAACRSAGLALCSGGIMGMGVARRPRRHGLRAVGIAGRVDPAQLSERHRRHPARGSRPHHPPGLPAGSRAHATGQPHGGDPHRRRPGDPSRKPPGSRPLCGQLDLRG
jgi:biotin synthase